MVRFSKEARLPRLARLRTLALLVEKAYVLTELEWQNCNQNFEEEGMKTFADWLKYYNNQDVAPRLQTLEKMVDFYMGKGIDILKNAVRIPDVSYNYIIKGRSKEGRAFTAQGLKSTKC